MEQTLSPKQVAEALGASESSLKRWTDTGRLRATRTPGGHRRIAVREAVRFARETDLDIARPELLGLPERRGPRRRREGADGAAGGGASGGAGGAEQLNAELGELLYDCLHRGDDAGARSLIIQPYVDGHSVAAICDGPVRYALDRLGQIWHHTQAGVFIEHRATEITVRALGQLRALLGPAPPAGEGREYVAGGADAAPVALGGAPPGDPYIIPTLAASCVVAECGFHSVNLGPDTPLEALLEAIGQYQPRLAWLSCSASRTELPPVGAMRHFANRLAEHHAALVVGGGQCGPLKAMRLPNVHFGETMSELAAFARGLRSR